jgi:hypothetical protein
LQAYEFHHAKPVLSRRDASYTAAALQERATSHQRASVPHASATASGAPPKWLKQSLDGKSHLEELLELVKFLQALPALGNLEAEPLQSCPG